VEDDMALIIETVDTLDRMDRHAYEAFHAASGAPVFYDWRMLLAAERSPLLPAERTFYLCARDGGDLVGFLPAYLQRLSVVDPLGLLAKTADVRDAGGELGLFSHMMHCWETTIPCTDARGDVRERLVIELRNLGVRAGASYAGLLNVGDVALLPGLVESGLLVRPMVDRYVLDLSRFDDFDHLVRELPRDGRNEMNRQLRKFAQSGATARVLAPPYGDVLERQCELCFETTARKGTPHYFPAGPLARFVRHCGDLARLVAIESEGRLIGGCICYQQGDTLHVWSAGITYDQSEFSPYTIFFATAYRYAFERGLRHVEAGRLNERIKLRLGLAPVPLYSALARMPSPHRSEVHPGIQRRSGEYAEYESARALID
jgi:predicted N-acyltransferase